MDVPLRDALESANGREGAAVTNCGDDKFIERRSVREPIDPLRKLRQKNLWATSGTGSLPSA